MANNKDNDVDELIGTIQGAVADQSSDSKLYGIDNDQLEIAADNEERPRPLKKKSNNKLQMYIGGAVLTLVGFAFLVMVVDMNSKQPSNQSGVAPDPAAEAMLFEGQAAGQAQQQMQQQFATEQAAQQPVIDQTQQPVPQQTMQNPWPQTDVSQSETLYQPTTQPELSQQISEQPVAQVTQDPIPTPAEQLQQPINQTEYAAEQNWNSSAQPQLEAPQSAPQSNAGSVSLSLRQSINETNAKLDKATELILQLAKRQEELEKKLAQNSSTGSSGEQSGNYVSQKQFLDVLRSLRAIQAQSNKNAAALKSLTEKLDGEPQPVIASRISSVPVAPVVRQPTRTTVTSTAINSPPSTDAVVQDQGRRQARQLAWSSYIEDFGVATIEGTPDLVDLRPGDVVLGRGVISKITSTGCIIFTNNTRYAPTNGECK